MVTPNPDGSVSFRLFRPGASSIEVRGGFVGWNGPGIPLRDEGDGWWSARAHVPPGDHLFSYLIDNAIWLPDYAASGLKANGFGGWVSQLHIAEAPTVAPARKRARAA